MRYRFCLFSYFCVMRVWAFPSFYPYDFPGMTNAGIFAHRQYKGLIHHGAELSVIVPVPWSPPNPFAKLHPEWENFHKLGYPKKRVYDGVTVYHPRISNIKPSRFVKKTYEQRFIECVVKFFKDQHVTLDPKRDIFYSQWLPGSYLVQQAAHRLGIKSAILSIGDDVALWPHSNQENFRQFRQVFEQADLRFACAHYLARQSNKLLGTDLPYTMVGWGVDYNNFKPIGTTEKQELRKKYEIADDTVVILNVGTASVRKGWLDLFDALGEVKKQNSNFLLIAVIAGSQDVDYDIEAESRGLNGNILILRDQPPAALSKLYNTADIFCLPSHAEGMANVVIEGMSSGLAVITTTVGGHPEIIETGVNGILVPPQQSALLASELLKLLNDKSMRERMGAAAREFIVRKWGNFTDNARVLYDKFAEALKA